MTTKNYVNLREGSCIYTLHVRIHSCDVSWLNCDGGGNAIFTVRRNQTASETTRKMSVTRAFNRKLKEAEDGVGLGAILLMTQMDEELLLTLRSSAASLILIGGRLLRFSSAERLFALDCGSAYRAS